MSESSAGPVVLAEYSVTRVVLLLVFWTAIFYFALEAPPSGGRGAMFKYPLFRGMFGLIMGSGLLMVLSFLGQMLFLNRRTVYVSNRRLCWPWAFGIMSVALDKISSFSLWKFPGIVIVNRTDGKRAYLASGLMRTASAELLAALERDLVRSTGAQP